jgi:hypothetical protein
MDCGIATKDVLNYLIAITPICIALFVAWIGLLQYRIGREKLRLDLYNRRFDIYSRVIDFYQALVSWDASETSKSVQRNFIKSYRESRFLFDGHSGIYQILDDMHTKSFKIIGFKEQGKNLASDPSEFLKMNDAAQCALAWFPEAISKLETKLSPYLNFHKLSA